VAKQPSLQIVDGDTLLGHRITVADGHRSIIKRLEIDGDAEWGTDLILSTIELADSS
jgi:hypothetical protein